MEENQNELIKDEAEVHDHHDGRGFVKYQGFWLMASSLEGVKFAQRYFKAHCSDIILCTFPKSGTTWLKALAFAITTRKNSTTHHTNSNPMLCTANPHECVQFIEAPTITALHDESPEFNRDLLEAPHLLATHINFSSLPPTIVTEPGCKVVYLYRNPKDVLVSSLYFFHTMNNFDYQGSSMEELFSAFCQGKTPFGPIWDHNLEYWRASLENPDKVLFLTYEDLKSDTRQNVKKLAEFMGQPFSEEEERQGEVQRIIELCSIESLRNLDVNKNGKCTLFGFEIVNSIFFRKGQVGDWKNHLTTEMTERLDQITQDKFRGSGLKFT